MQNYTYLKTWLQARFSDTDRGASLVEYALLVALIAVICIVAISAIGREADTTFQGVADELEGVNAN